MSHKPGIYYDYDQNDILNFLMERKGNLNDYQRTRRPELPPNSIYAWMGAQPTEFRVKCRAHRSPSTKKAAQIEKFHCDLERLNLIQDQKNWRQSLPEVVTLFKGDMNT
jgi:hypothetical protein